MPSKTIILAILIFLSSVFYQIFLKDFLRITFRASQTSQKIEDFPYDCRRLRHPLLESCEDLVLDSDGRTVYAACSKLVGRKEWAPGGDSFNASGRSLTDHVSVLNIDEPGEDGLHGLHALEITGAYTSAIGGKDVVVVGIELEVISEDRVRLFMVNAQPYVDSEGHLLDATKLGANMTVEIFEHIRGSKQMEHIKTILSDAVFAPNNIATTGDGGFYVTNDHDTKVSMFRPLAIVLGGGSVAYCSLSSSCNIATTQKSMFANGIIQGFDNVIYVAQTSVGKIYVYSKLPDHSLLKIDEINIGMAIDNLSIDSEGNIFVAGFPKPLALLKAAVSTGEHDVPSAIFRVRRVMEGSIGRYEVDKVLEDIEGKVLPGSTVAVHDVKTDTFFMGGVTSPFVTVCKRQS